MAGWPRIFEMSRLRRVKPLPALEARGFFDEHDRDPVYDRIAEPVFLAEQGLPIFTQLDPLLAFWAGEHLEQLR